MIRTMFAVVMSVLMIGCGTMKTNYQPQPTKISEPPIGSVETAYVGDSLLRQGKYVEHDMLYFEKNTKVNWAFTLLAGYYKKTGEDDKADYYYPSGGEQSGNIEKAALADDWRGISIDKDKNKLCIIVATGFPVCKDGLYFERKKKPLMTADSFQQTLIYSGKVGDKINIGYREFSNNYARPAYNNDVEYDLSESKTIGYKGAKIEVLEATNEYIKYKVIKNFNKASF